MTTGTAVGPTMAIPSGSSNPEISEEFDDVTVPGMAPSVYSPIVPRPSLVTNRSDPETAMPTGSLLLPNETKSAFTVVPEVVYSPIVPLPLFTTNKSDPETAMPTGSLLLPNETNEAFTVAPEVVYSPIVLVPSLMINRSDPEMAMPTG